MAKVRRNYCFGLRHGKQLERANSFTRPLTARRVADAVEFDAFVKAFAKPSQVRDNVLLKLRPACGHELLVTLDSSNLDTMAAHRQLQCPAAHCESRHLQTQPAARHEQMYPCCSSTSVASCKHIAVLP